MNVYAILADIPSQQAAVTKFCFGSCGKILVGCMRIPMDDGELVAFACRESDCPALDRQFDEPIGLFPGTDEPVFLRKLRAGITSLTKS